MAKFDKRPGSSRQRPERPSGNRRNKPLSSGDKPPDSDRDKKSDYKAKRSFTRNKGFRDKKESAGDKPYRPFDRDRPFKSKFKKEGDKPFSDKPRKSYPDKDEATDRRGKRSEFKKEGDRPFSDRPRKSFSDREESTDRRNKRGEERPHSDKPERRSGDRENAGRKPFNRDSPRPASDRPKKSFINDREERGDGEKKKRLNKRDARNDEPETNKRVKFDEFEDGKVFSGSRKSERFDDRKGRKKGPAPVKKSGPDDGLVRLNKYLSNAGIASRREADVLIQSGAVKVNGVVVDQLGYKIKPGDKVTYGDESVKGERKVYLLLNKPKDYITTLDDPQGRKTVMELLDGACRERVYPVGRLDRNTTGLLLFTNDGEITTRLTHPKFGVKKIYHVSLNKGLKPDDFKAIIEGVELEDGIVKADDLAFVGEGKKEIGIEIHSGRNRVVRRLFEHLGYDVLKLDRVAFAGLTKKDLPRGKYRFLTAKEISFLHMVG